MLICRTTDRSISGGEVMFNDIRSYWAAQTEQTARKRKKKGECLHPKERDLLQAWSFMPNVARILELDAKHRKAEEEKIVCKKSGAAHGTIASIGQQQLRFEAEISELLEEFRLFLYAHEAPEDDVPF
jgi:hypothetical protein